ncbi:MAG: crotonase/enoyl-CoA hydratase family protein [Holophagales bacterium]|nr:crotonase/enoyl-CoA hydratase family protein [Holophagales bacterium]MYF94083.1 crotonase/enoyl-CoA hydratase family protein [Holophagales bacterium]
MTEPTTYEQVGDVALVTMNDGKANVFGPPMIGAVNAGLDRAADEAKAVVLTGRPGVFSGGFDLNVFRDGGPAEARAMGLAGARLMMRLYGWPQPLVVAASGHAIALGALCVLTGDHRLAADGELRLGLNEVAIGRTLPPFAWLLAKERLSKRALTQAALTAKMYDPEGARDAGFVDEVAPADELRAVALERAAQLAEFDANTFSAMKQGLRGEGIDAVLAGLGEAPSNGP